VTGENKNALRALPTPLVLPNAWDPASAAAIQAAGAKAIATTSGGVSWSRGVPDAGGLGRTVALEALRRIVRAVTVPVTADIEDGYGDTPEEVAWTIAEVASTGALGVNIEDSAGGALLDVEAQVERLAAARAAGDLVINARTDTFLLGSGDVAETLARAERYAAAGADSLFVPGVIDPAVIKVLVDGPLPLNVMAHPGAPTVPELAALGVARISVGTGIAQAAYGLAAAVARELLTAGTYDSLAEGLSYGELNDLLR